MQYIYILFFVVFLLINQSNLYLNILSLYFYSKDSSPVGVIGGIATNFILDSKKPLLSIVKKDDEIHVS